MSHGDKAIGLLIKERRRQPKSGGDRSFSLCAPVMCQELIADGDDDDDDDAALFLHRKQRETDS